MTLDGQRGIEVEPRRVRKPEHHDAALVWRRDQSLVAPPGEWAAPLFPAEVCVERRSVGLQASDLVVADLPSEAPQGVAALVHLKQFSVKDILERLQVGPVVIILGLQDPGNLGTILRSAEAFGSAGIVLGEGTVSPFNSKVIRASSGSIFRLPLVIAKAAGEMENVLGSMRTEKIRLIATSSHKGIPLNETKLRGPAAVFIGSEGAGLPRDLLSQVDELVAIPHTPQVESLNAGVAGSIILYEAARQRRE